MSREGTLWQDWEMDARGVGLVVCPCSLKGLAQCWGLTDCWLGLGWVAVTQQGRLCTALLQLWAQLANLPQPCSPASALLGMSSAVPGEGLHL